MSTHALAPRQIWIFSGVLVVMGSGWGLTQPLSKIAVSTGYQHFGLIFWQLVIGVAFLAIVARIGGKGLPFTRPAFRLYVIIALLGTVIPNSASYQAIIHLPAGVHSILISLVPIFAFPIAIALGMERFDLRRFAGLTLGLIGVLFLILPKASLPDPAMLPWIPVAALAALCYAFEGNYVARWGTGGLDAIEVLYGASLIGAFLVLPLAVSSGQFINPFTPWGPPEWSLVAGSLIHVTVYSGYVWLVGRAGAVFTAQVSYLVTGFGVFWAMTILGESYSPFIWVSLTLALIGVALVQPRRRRPLAGSSEISQTRPRSDETSRTDI